VRRGALNANFSPPREVEVEFHQIDLVKFDAEGGAKAGAPPTRLLSAGVEVGLGAASFLGDSFDQTGPRAAGAAGGFKLVGIALGLTIHLQLLGIAVGALGAGRSIYANFIAPGQDAVFPKNTVLAVGIESRPPPILRPSDTATGQ
jgi:hypothetical protein